MNKSVVRIEKHANFIDKVMKTNDWVTNQRESGS